MELYLELLSQVNKKLLFYIIISLALMWVKLNNDKWNSPLNLVFIVGSTILTIIGYSAAILSLLTAFDTVKI